MATPTSLINRHSLLHRHPQNLKSINTKTQNRDKGQTIIKNKTLTKRKPHISTSKKKHNRNNKNNKKGEKQKKKTKTSLLDLGLFEKFLKKLRLDLSSGG